MHQNNQVNLRLTNYDIEQLIVEFILSPDYKLRNLLASEIHPYLNRVIYKHHKSHEEIYQSY